MWKHEKNVALILERNALFLCWLQPIKNHSSLFMPQAWSKKTLDELQVESSILFNPTFLVQEISEFLKKNALKDAFVSICLDNMLWENAVWLENEHPTTDHLSIQAQSLIWNYTYICSNAEKKRHFFYLFGIAREILFQYQLLALQVPFYCSTITSLNRALLYTCSHVTFSPTFNETHEINITQNCLQQFEEYDPLHLFHNPSDQFLELYHKEKKYIIASLGLALLRNNNELN